MKSKLKRIFSAFLSMTVLTCTLPVAVITTSAAEENSTYECDAQDIKNIQDGVILHCFDWKYTHIIEELPNIAAAGFNAIQTSPAQPGGNHDPDAESGIWWWLYQPLSFSIGTNYLGTKEELTQLCTEAHKYGIEVIVDIVANHLAGSHTYIQEDLKPSKYWRETKSDDYWNSVSKRYKTTHKDLGMPDIVSEDEYVQECVKNYVQELKSVGVDGLRWDTLKHIQVPSEDCAFFTTVIDDEMYNYGESLGDPGGNDDTENKKLMKEYTGLMSVTDDVYGNQIRGSLNSGSVPSTQGNWATRGMNANKLVYWGESHDTWSNDETGTTGTPKYTTNISQNVIDRTYAIVASRAGATSLYFSRPSATKKDDILAGVKGSTHFTSAEVAAVNHFHNTFNWQSEYYSKSGNIIYVERGIKGVVLVNAPGGSATVNVTAHKMVDGTYTDQVTGNKFTVSGGTISGKIGSTGIAVVYNPDDVDEPYITSDTMYFLPNSNWIKNKNERFAMYLWNGSSSTWADLTDPDGDGTYSASVPEGKWTGVIFGRMNGSTTENNWDNVWNKTVDLFPDENTNRYTMRDGSWNETEETKGTWDEFVHIHHYDCSNPTWTWADDCSSATASFPCSGCDESFTATDNAPAVLGYIRNIRKRTATVTGPDGKSYTSLVKYEPMIVQESPEDGVKYQTANSELLNELYEATMAHEEEIILSSYNLPKSDGAYITQALQNIYPELFFVDFFRYYSSGDDLYSIVPVYNMDKATADKKVDEFNAKADEYLSMIDNSMDDFTKALILHDQLVQNNYYPTTEELQDAANNYDFMVNGWGVCRNYTEVYAYLLAREGIKSEIVTSDSMTHEWLRICLDGSYYNVDVTWDDPYSSAGNIYHMRHAFFLLSDSLIGDSNYYSDTHQNYYHYYDTSTKYDSYNNLHTVVISPFVYLNNKLYTVYRQSDTTIVIATYNPQTDTLSNVSSSVNGKWSADGNSYWTESYSGMEQHDGKLYINGEKTVYEFDPATNKMTTLISYDEHQLYGLYIKDNKLFGLSADSPRDVKTPVELYTFPVNNYTVKWVNYDGTTLEIDKNVAVGTKPEYNGAPPTRSGNAQYTYTFAGWTPEISDVTENVTYTATYSETLNEYTVTWKDDDGNVLKTEQIPYGTTPSYGGTPTKANTLQYSYTFADWTPEITAVTGNAEYKANFTAVPAEIWTITAYNFAGWENVSLYYWNSTGENAAWPGEQLTASDNFTFTATIPSTVEGIIFNDGTEKGAKTANITSGIANNAEWGVGTKDGSVTCNIAKYYLVGTMNNWDINGALEFSPNKNDTHTEEFILTTQLNQGDRFKAKSSDGRWFPYGADKGITINRTGTYNIYVRPNADGFAEWNNYVLYAEAVTHCVNFDSGVDSQTIYHNETATEPEAPVKYGYTFDGWYLVDTLYDFNTPVTEDITLTAHWTEKTVNIQFKGFNGKDKTTLEIFAVNGSFSDESVKSQIRANIPSASYIDGYQLVGWTLNNTKYGIDEQENLITALAGLVAEISDDAIIINEVYEQKDEEYTVTVNNGKIKNGGTTGTFKPSDQVYVTATGGAEGQKFSYWTKQDEDSVSPVKVGYETTYAFRMPSKDTTLSAVFQDKPEEKVGTAYIENVTVHDGNKISFVSVVSVPDNATILRAGIVACKESDITAEYDNVPNIDIARFKRYNDTTCKNYKSFKYTWTKGNVDTNDIWCVRAYLLYQDAGGEEHNVYSPIVKADLVHNGIIPQDS